MHSCYVLASTFAPPISFLCYIYHDPRSTKGIGKSLHYRTHNHGSHCILYFIYPPKNNILYIPTIKCTHFDNVCSQGTLHAKKGCFLSAIAQITSPILERKLFLQEVYSCFYVLFFFTTHVITDWLTLAILADCPKALTLPSINEGPSSLLLHRFFFIFGPEVQKK